MVRKDIKLVRGNTLQFDVSFSDVDATVSYMYFSAKGGKYGCGGYAFQKSIGDGITEVDEMQYRVRLAPVDTIRLPLGDYDYDLKVGLGADGITIIGGKFSLLKNTTEEIA